MKPEILLAQLKAFQIYLKSSVDDIKLRPKTKFEEDSDDDIAQYNATRNENSHINARYTKLKLILENEYPDIFYRNLESLSVDEVNGIERMYREINFVLDTITNLSSDFSSFSINNHDFKTNNQSFTEEEIEIIYKQLDELQDKLIKVINDEIPSTENAKVYIDTIKNELDELKTEVKNPNLGRKDWKNQLISTMISLTFTLSFSQEARSTIFEYFHILFTYFQQHIFLLKY